MVSLLSKPNPQVKVGTASAKAAEVLVLYEIAGPVRYTSVSISVTCSLPISVPAPEATDLLPMEPSNAL